MSEVTAQQLLDNYRAGQREIEYQQGCPNAIDEIQRSLAREASENYEAVLVRLVNLEEELAMAKSDWGTHGPTG